MSSRSRLKVALAGALFLLLLAAPSFASHALWRHYFPYGSFGEWEKVGDFNGDGFGDFVYSTWGQFDMPSIHMVLGAPYDEPHPEIVLESPESNKFQGLGIAGPLCALGDFDGDGFDDLLLFRTGFANQVGRDFLVFRGGAVPDLMPDLVVHSTIPGSPLIRPIGDLNADGFDDFAIGVSSDFNGAAIRGSVSICFGGPVLDVNPDLILEGVGSQDAFGSAFAGERDFNGDGYVDLAVGAPNFDGPLMTDAGEIRIYFGGPSLDTTPDLILDGSSPSASLGGSLDFLRDFDGDGHTDLVVSVRNPSPPFHRVSVLRGGPAFNGVPFWGVDAEDVGLSVRAGDDVNRDRFSDVLVVLRLRNVDRENPSPIQRGSHVYFGASAADTIPDTPLPYAISWDLWAATSAEPAGDVDGDGYQDWFIANGGFTRIGIQLNLLTARNDYEVSPIGSVVGGSSIVVRWFGAGPVNLLYSTGAGAWQTLATGVGGQLENSTPVVIPSGNTSHARIRVVSVADDSSFATSPPFTVTGDYRVDCTSAVSLDPGVGLGWKVTWYSQPPESAGYRLYREDGGVETRVGTDVIRSDVFRDDEGSASSRYRLAAVAQGGGEMTLASIEVGTPPCDTIRIDLPSAETTWNIPCRPVVNWRGTRWPFDVWLSVDDGVTWMRMADRGPNLDWYQWGDAIPKWTDRARVRVNSHDLPWIQATSEPFKIRGLLVQRFEAASNPQGVLVTWRIPAAITCWNGVSDWAFSLMRADSGGAEVKVAFGNIGPGAVGYLDPDGKPGSQYRLRADGDGAEVWIAETTYVPPPDSTSPAPEIPPVPTPVRVGPSPARRASPVNVFIPVLRTSDGRIANDLDVIVFDLRGRPVARIAEHQEARFEALQWTPAASHLPSGVYWLRARSTSSGYSSTIRFVIVD